MTTQDYLEYFTRADIVDIDLSKVARQLRSKYPFDSALIDEALFHMGIF